MKNKGKISIICIFIIFSIFISNSIILKNESSSNYIQKNQSNISEEPKQSAGEIYNIVYINPTKTITSLYNYTVNITVLKAIGWGFHTPEITIYSDPSDREIDWTKMNGTWGGNAGWYNWNFTFDPIILPNNLYTFTIRIYSEDYIPPSYCFNNSQEYVINNPPNVEIVSPSESSYIKTNENYTIQCNITNEEKINIVKWDLVQTLGSYNWKLMEYNISSEFYEAIFNISEYSIGHHFLCINASDDKNHSLTIKELDFTRSSNGAIIYNDNNDDDNGNNNEDISLLELLEIWWVRAIIGGAISGTVAITIKILYSRSKKKKKKSSF